MTFDGKDAWSFNDDFARNVIIFGDDNSSSCHTNNLKNDLSSLELILIKQKQSFFEFIIMLTIVIYL